MRRRAVTIVELLVVIAVLAILLGILLPTLRGALRSSKDTVNLTSLRSTHQQFFQWGAAHRDVFVNQGLPAPGTPFVLRAGSSPGTIVGHYTMQTEYWTWPLGAWLEEGYPTWHPAEERPLPESEVRLQSMMVSYPGALHFRASMFKVSNAMYMDPQRFTPDCGSRLGNSVFRPVRWSEAAFPSSKVLLFHSGQVTDPTRNEPGVSLVTVDGAARPVPAAGAITLPGSRCAERPFEDTPLGIMGRDFVNQ
ncbi:MAG: type II secretion system protein [Phycisphaeraceae bacterium]|nr:type II secretion system protein [Phycisphaeraceae bacterium]